MNDTIEYYKGLMQKEEAMKQQSQVASAKITESIANQKICDISQKEFELHRDLQSTNRFQ